MENSTYAELDCKFYFFHILNITGLIYYTNTNEYVRGVIFKYYRYREAGC